MAYACVRLAGNTCVSKRRYQTGVIDRDNLVPVGGICLYLLVGVCQPSSLTNRVCVRSCWLRPYYFLMLLLLALSPPPPGNKRDGRDGLDASNSSGSAGLGRRFGASSPSIKHLVKTLLQSSVTQRRQFLSFVTSVPIVTPGQIEVVPILGASGELIPLSDSCLPRANTCARKLYLPKFADYESFSTVLWAVLREESKFKGFYEWRGN